MNRGEYKSLPGPGLGSTTGEMEAGKPNGSTVLDLGGECEVSVFQRDGEVQVRFKAEDRTKGVIRFPEEALE